MRYLPTTEQTALFTHTRDYLDGVAEAERTDLAAPEQEASEPDTSAWERACTDLGVTSILTPDSDGTVLGDFVDLAMVLEAAGQSLTTLPVWQANVGVIASTRLAEADRAAPLLSDIAAGKSVPMVVGLHPSDSFAALKSDTGWAVTGEARHVPGFRADHGQLVIAMSADGVRLFHISPDTAGVTTQAESTLDPTRRLHHVSLSSAAAVDLTGSLSLELNDVHQVRHLCSLALAIEACGTAERSLTIATEYAKSRHQFGRPIGGFQALKHVLADMRVDTEIAHTSARVAAWSAATDAADLGILSSATNLVVLPRVIDVCARTLQVLGGIGYTWEHPAHFYYKRALSTARILDTLDNHRDTIVSSFQLADSR